MFAVARKLALVAALLLALIVAIAPSAEAATKKSCRAKHSKTEFSANHVRVYSIRHVHRKQHFTTYDYYACSDKFGRHADIGTIDPGNEFSDFSKFVVAGNVLAYTSLSEGVADGSETYVDSISLRSGRILADDTAAIGESQVTDLVVKANGSIAWIVGWEDLVDSKTVTNHAVRKNEKFKTTTLETSPAIVPGTLQLSADGKMLSWNGAEKAPLN